MKKDIVMYSRSLVLGLSLCIPAAVACSGTDQSLFQERGGAPLPPPGTSGSFGSSTPNGTGAACVTSLANAQLTPVSLVVMYDKSGSMGEAPDFDPNLKWVPVGTGMKAFFADPGSAGMNASLQFFPQGGSVDDTCNYAYATPKVPITALTSTSAFVAAIDTTTPSGGTPTLPALNGAIAYAKDIAHQRPQDKTVVVLVTDGEPGYRINSQNVPGCPNNDIPHVAAAAQAAASGSPSIATYVIGVGPSLTNLNAIASAGGTGQAIMVSVADPAQTKGLFQKALESIRAQTLSCVFGLPQPPDGKKLDINAVNVVFTSGSGKETVLSYSGDCASGAGWHYDNLAAPTKIELCAASCSTAQSDRAAKISIAFGCKTNGIIK